jgi:hypothetical protein
MRYAFDESGDFLFPQSGFDSCAVAAVACPDSAAGHIESEFARLRAVYDVPEIHAARLPPGAVRAACAVIGASDLLWTSVYTDTRLLPVAQQLDFRRRQVEKADAGIAKSVTLANDPERMAAAERTRNRILHATRVGIAEYLEFLVLFPRAIGDIIAASIRAYRNARFNGDFAQLRFESDRKLTTKLSMGEKTLTAALPHFLANNDQFVLDIPPTWGPSHPFIANHRNGDTGGIAVPNVLGPGIAFVDSAESSLVQAADVIAHVTRRATGNPADTDAQTAYGLLRRRGFATTALPVRIFSDREGPSGDPAWFAHLL